MFWLRKLSHIVHALFSTNGHRVEDVKVPHIEPEIDEPLPRADEMLSLYFSLYELTVTSNPLLQGSNRILTKQQIAKLKVLAQHADTIRAICGGLPVRIHSGYRSDKLNSATIGSSSTSQHPRCEAIDLDVKGQTIEDTFRRLLLAAKAGKFKFGQLILERAERSYGSAAWIHCSVVGTLSPEKIGQVMKMEAGPDGHSRYTLIDHLKFPEL